MTRYEHNYRLLNDLLGNEGYRIIENNSYLPLVVGWRDGEPLIALYQHCVLGGESMVGPKVVFLVEGEAARPVYFQSDYAGVRCATVEGYFEAVRVVPHVQGRLDTFSVNWLRTLEQQGFFARAWELNASQAARLAGPWRGLAIEAGPEQDGGPEMGP